MCIVDMNMAISAFHSLKTKGMWKSFPNQGETQKGCKVFFYVQILTLCTDNVHDILIPHLILLSKVCYPTKISYLV